MKKFIVFLLAFFLIGCSPLQVKKGSKPLAKLNLGSTQVVIDGVYSGDLYTPAKKDSLGRINIDGTMRDLK